MSSPRKPQRGFILLVVLTAVAVLSLIAAFIYSRTENQLLLSVAARGQSMAAARATYAAERTLAIFRSPGYAPTSVLSLPTNSDYPTAVSSGQIIQYGTANYNLPGLDLSSGNGAQWCVEVWRMFRGTNVAPWVVIEAWGFYGFTNPLPSPPGVTGFVTPGCQPQGTNPMSSSHITVHLETNQTSGGGPSPPPCPACGTGTQGAS
jgi:hypothetical protein